MSRVISSASEPPKTIRTSSVSMAHVLAMRYFSRFFVFSQACLDQPCVLLVSAHRETEPFLLLPAH